MKIIGNPSICGSYVWKHQFFHTKNKRSSLEVVAGL